MPALRCSPSPGLPDHCVYEVHADHILRPCADARKGFLVNTPLGRWARQRGVLGSVTVSTAAAAFLLHNIPLAAFWTDLTVAAEDGSDVKYYVSRPGTSLSLVFYAAFFVFLHFLGHWLDRRVLARVVLHFECLTIVGFSLAANCAYSYNVFLVAEDAQAEVLLLQGMEFFILTPLVGLLCGAVDALDTHTRNKALANAAMLIANIGFYYFHRSLVDADPQRCFWSVEEVCWFACGTPKAMYLMSRLILVLFLSRPFACYLRGLPFGVLRAHYKISTASDSREGPGEEDPPLSPLTEDALKSQQEALQLADQDAAPLEAGLFAPPAAADRKSSDDHQSVIVEAGGSLQIPPAIPVPVETVYMSGDGVPKSGSTVNAVIDEVVLLAPPLPLSDVQPVSALSAQGAANQNARNACGSSPPGWHEPNDGHADPVGDPDDESLALERARSAEQVARVANMGLDVEALADKAKTWKTRARALERELWDAKCQTSNTMQLLARWDQDMAVERQQAHDLHEALICELDAARVALAAERVQRNLLYQRLHTLEAQVPDLSPPRSASVGKAIIRSTKPKPENSAVDDVRHMYIGQLPNTTEEAALAAYFEDYGEVEGVNLAERWATDDDGLESSRWAVVSFQDPASVHGVLKSNGLHEMEGCRFTCVPADASVLQAIERLRRLESGVPASSAASTRAADSNASPSLGTMMSPAASMGTPPMTAAGKASPLPTLPDDSSNDTFVPSRRGGSGRTDGAHPAREDSQL